MATRKVIRGDSDSFKITFVSKTTNSSGRTVTTPIDICNWEIRFTVRKDIPSTTTTSDTDAIISKVADIVDGENGIAYVTITSSDTNINPGEYWYDIQYIYTNSCGEQIVKSIPMRKYIVVADITRNERGY